MEIDAYARRNLRLYIVLKIFAKRVFLPLTAIYFMDEAGFTLPEIGVLASFFFLIQVLAEVPTGYFADRVARTTSIRLAALLNMAATLIYVFFPTKVGIFPDNF